MLKNLAIVTLLILFVIGILYWQKSASNIAGKGKPIVSIIVPNIPSNLQFGNNLFDSKCSRCHGVNAVGKEGIGPPLVHKIYEPNHHADASFALAAKNGVRSHHWPFGNMPPIGDITNSEIDEIINYIRYLQRANGIGFPG